MFLVQHHLYWLEHMTRMNNDHLPKQMLFGEFLTTMAKTLQWRDGVLRQRIGLGALSWYDVAQDCSRWYDLCQTITPGGDPTVITGCMWLWKVL